MQTSVYSHNSSNKLVSIRLSYTRQVNYTEMYTFEILSHSLEESVKTFRKIQTRNLSSSSAQVYGGKFFNQRLRIQMKSNYSSDRWPLAPHGTGV